MRADGTLIPDYIVDKAIEWVRSQTGPFKAIQLAKFFQSYGVPWTTPSSVYSWAECMPCYQAANSLLQTLRKAGAIRFVKGKGAHWELVP